jgi:LPS export ABC transporter protein LptC
VGLKIFAIAITLFLAEVVFITTKDFKTNTPIEKDIDFTDVAFENVDGYVITKDGINSNLKASKVLKYRDYVKAFDVKSNFLKEERAYKVSAKNALLQGDIIELNGNVHYKNIQKDVDVKSQHLQYNTKSELIHSKTPFILTTKTSITTGNNFEYDQKEGKIKAKNLNYKSKP